MKKRYFDASTMHLVNKETGELIDTKENDVVEIAPARISKHTTFKRHDFKGEKFFSLNADMFQHYLNRAELKWKEKGFLLQLLMHNCASNYCILLDSEDVPLTTKSIALEFDLNESTVSGYLKKLFEANIIKKAKDIRPRVKSLQVLYVNPFCYKNTSNIHKEVIALFTKGNNTEIIS
jgi:DNA-binding transcriptional ArsR family regulator